VLQTSVQQYIRIIWNKEKQFAISGSITSCFVEAAKNNWKTISR